jgi:hypothetical protein
MQFSKFVDEVSQPSRPTTKHSRGLTSDNLSRFKDFEKISQKNPSHKTKSVLSQHGSNYKSIIHQMKKDKLKEQVEELQSKINQKSEQESKQSRDKPEQFSAIQSKINDLLSSKPSQKTSLRHSRRDQSSEVYSRRVKHSKTQSVVGSHLKDNQYVNSKLIQTDDLTIKKLIEFSSNFNDDINERHNRKMSRDISFVTSPQNSRKLRVKSAYGGGESSVYKLRSRKGLSLNHSRQAKVQDSSMSVFKEERHDNRYNESVKKERSPIRMMNNYTSAGTTNDYSSSFKSKNKKDLAVWEQVLAHKLGYEWKNIFRMLL